MKNTAVQAMIAAQYNIHSHLIEVEFLSSEYVKGAIQYTFSVIVKHQPAGYDYPEEFKRLTVNVSQIDITDLPR